MKTNSPPMMGLARFDPFPFPVFFSDGPPFTANLEPRRLLPPKKVVKRARNRKAKKK